MRRGMVNSAVGLLVVVLVGAAGCKVQVDKSGEGEAEHVKIATPFGSIAVNKDKTTASDVGLPAYPGATVESGGDGRNSAKVDMGFGSWKLRVRVANYSTGDKREQVVEFYRKALSQYGAVITCAGDKPVGTPVTTGEGLSCADSGHGKNGMHENFRAGEFELKAGSQRHQHLVVLQRDGASASPTQFTLIALDLPHGMQEEDAGTN